MLKPLTPDDYRHVFRLWEMGCNTYDIARILEVRESEVHNALPRIREAYLVKREASCEPRRHA